MLRRSIFLPILWFLIGESFGANLLFLTLLGAPSHHIWNEALVGGLLKNGHNITLLGHDKPKIKSATYTVLYIEDNFTSDPTDISEMTRKGPALHLMMEWGYQMYLCELHLKSPVVKELMAYPNNFDLIVFDVGAGQCVYPLLDIFSKAKVIGVSAFATPPSIAAMMGHEVPSYVPVYSSEYGKEMNLWERAHNFFLQAFEIGLRYYYLGIMYKKSQEVFGEGIRDFYDVEKDFLFLLANNDPILDYPQSYPSNIIPVGGLHIKASTKLNEELQNILDNAKHGVIYFSLGSFVKSTAMSKDVKMAFLKVFKELKQIVLWKYEGDDLDTPQNVIVRKWFPQEDILAHNNVILFISHCGGLSTQEAVYFGVPVLGIPIFIDQRNHVIKISSKGGGLMLKYHELSYEKLRQCLTELLENPRYRNEMKRLSTLFRDQHVHPLDKAIFWIEYLLRNTDNYRKDLNPSIRNMSWHQKYSLHFLMLMILFSLLFLMIGATVYIYYRFTSQKHKKKTKIN